METVWLNLLILVSGLVFSALFLRVTPLFRVSRGLGSVSLMIFKAFVVLWSIYLFLATMARFNNFVSESIDVAYYHQVVWQLTEFKVPRIWDIPSRFVWGDHFEPILFFFVPFYWLVKDANILMAAQVLLTISGIIPICLLVKRKFGSEWLGLAVALAYLLFGGLQMGYAYGFHPIVLFPAIFFWAYYFEETDQQKWYILFLAMSLLIKEEISFVMAAFGLYCFVFKKKRKLGLLTFGAGLIWYWLCFLVIFPAFNPGGFGHWGQYSGVTSGGVVLLVEHIVLNPGLFLKTLVTPSYKIETFMVTFGSFAFLPLLYPPAWIMVAPPLLEKLLSSNIAALNGFHYSAVIWAVVTVSSIEALACVKNRKIPLPSLARNSNFWAGLIVYVAVVGNIFSGYGPLSLKSFSLGYFSRPNHVEVVYRIVGALPRTASVAASYQIAPHVGRPFGKVHPLPNMSDQPPEDADFVVIDFNLPLVLNTRADLVTYLARLEQSGRYDLVVNENGVVVLQKKAV